MSVDLQARIPNNVDLAGDRRLQRALEHWQPAFHDWWLERGPEGLQKREIYLRTAVAVDRAGWAHYDYVRMPDYRWGIFLSPPEPDRLIRRGGGNTVSVWTELRGPHRTLVAP